MKSVHLWLGWFVVAANAFVGVWALAAHWRNELQRKELFTATWIAWGAISLQVSVGALLIGDAEPEPPQIHYFYGALCIAAVAIIYSYRPQVEQWQFLLYGAGNLFVAGLALRAMFLRI